MMESCAACRMQLWTHLYRLQGRAYCTRCVVGPFPAVTTRP